jgi:regulatory protein
VAIITKIELQKNRKGINVHLDGKFAFSLNSLVAFKTDLKKGQTLSEAQVARLLLDSDFQRFYDRCLDLISRRPHSESEIRRYLTRKIPDSLTKDDLVDQIVNRLTELHYLDDSAFADWWLNQRATFRPKSRLALKAELTDKGINPDLIKEKFTQLDPDDEYQQALAIAQKRIVRFHTLPPQQIRQKLTGYLARKGYNWDLITKILEEILKKK